jgi:ubiquinone/menaquinone biosynthesis C-methylase UbiE
MGQKEYFAARTADSVERERLAALEAARDPKSKRHLQELGVGPGWKCLEVGGGGGSITRWLAEKVGSDGRVVAIDIDTRFLREIEQPNVETRELDILRDAFEDSRYDLVHCRLLLIHLSDPELAVRRMIGAARLGGLILIEEADFSSYQAADPDHPLSEFFTRKVREIFENVGRSKLFDPYFGRRARALLERAGLSGVASEGTVYLWHGGEAEAHEHRLSLPALVKAGVCSERDSLELQKALSDPGFAFVGNAIFSAWGRRAV